MKTKKPDIQFPVPRFPGDGFNHIFAPDVRIQKLACPCGHIIVTSITKVVEEDSTIATCPNCQSWHSILWRYPEPSQGGSFILAGRD